jgi:hypothetical protein
MSSRYLVACIVCVVTLGCNRTDASRSEVEFRMNADTARTIDSLSIGEEAGPQSLAVEPSVADPSSTIGSGALSDLRLVGPVDTTSGSRPRPMQSEPRAGPGKMQP